MVKKLKQSQTDITDLKNRTVLNYTKWSLIKQNLIFYRRKNLAVILGICISSAVLIGAFLAGDTVRQNLRQMVNLRLGKINYIVTTGERYVTTELARQLQQELNVHAAPVLRSEGIAVAGGGELRVNKVQVLGVDDAFDKVLGISSIYAGLRNGEAIISQNLAERLRMKAGEEFLLRVKKTGSIPLNTPFVSDEEITVASRLTIKAVATEEQMEGFNTGISQTRPYNVFIASSCLNQLLEMEDKSNLLLLSGNSLSSHSVLTAINKRWSLEDAGLSCRSVPGTGDHEIISDRVFLDKPVIDAIISLPVPGEFILTYFVNSITSRENSTPYSFISSLPDSIVPENNIIVNSWLADDLKIRKGDSLTVKFYITGALRRLAEVEHTFTVQDIVPIESRYADRTLMPVIPGLSDAGNCRDWDTGIPVDLSRIRDKDEKYWTDYQGTPKAYISLSLAKELWENMYGSYTAVRFNPELISKDTLVHQIITHLYPASLGFRVSDIRSESIIAADKGVDFSQLFLALSFFVILSGLILIVLLFILNIEGRRTQLETLSALGIPRKVIHNVMFTEGFILAVTGSLAGILLAILYTGLIVSALNNVWNDIVRTDMLQMVVRIPVLLSGLVLSVLISWLTLFFTIRSVIKQGKIHKATTAVSGKTTKKIRPYIILTTGLVSLGLIFSQIISSDILNSGIFLAAGGLMLISLMLLFYHLLQNAGKSHFSEMNVFTLALKYSLRNKNRSLSIVALLAIGTFIVLSTGANRKDMFADAGDKASGTGGYLFYSETTVPVVRDLNNREVRHEYGLRDDIRFVQFSRVPGDDASCLNLNRISNPSILGVNPEELEGRFRFVSRTPYLSNYYPWASLENPLPGGLIPAIADQTVIKWGLGMKVGDTLTYTDNSGKTSYLLLTGGLANSVFQGNIIIADTYFQKHFPDYIGSGILLIDAPPEDEDEIRTELEYIFRDHGWEMTNSAQRLAEFNSVENTYLSIFMLMGALAILIGTVGLSTILARSILERRNEIALMKAVGINRKKVLKMLLVEYSLLLFAGIMTGLFTSAIAAFPSLISPNTEISGSSVFITALILFLNGIFWIWLMASVFLKHKAIGQALRNE